jgi:hypothetical protein
VFSRTISISLETELAIMRLLLRRSREGEFGRDYFKRGPTVFRTAFMWWIGKNSPGMEVIKLGNRQAAAVARGDYKLSDVPPESRLRENWNNLESPCCAMKGSRDA